MSLRPISSTRMTIMLGRDWAKVGGETRKRTKKATRSSEPDFIEAVSVEDQVREHHHQQNVRRAQVFHVARLDERINWRFSSESRVELAPTVQLRLRLM